MNNDGGAAFVAVFVITAIVFFSIGVMVTAKSRDGMYKRNTIEVPYEADANGIRRGRNMIIIDLSGTYPVLKGEK